jgi:hypothetical protein
VSLRNLLIAVALILVFWVCVIIVGFAVLGRPAQVVEAPVATPESPVPTSSLTISVTRVDQTFRSSRSDEVARPGNRFILVQLALKNNGATPLDYERDAFALQDDKGTSYRPASVTVDPPLPGGPLAAGSTSAGSFVFELPTDAVPKTLAYRPSNGPSVSVNLP